MSTLVARPESLQPQTPRRAVAAAFPEAQLIPQGEYAHFPSVNVGRPLTIIGNGPQAHLRLRSRTISKRHAILLNVDGCVSVADLASRTRTSVNGRIVRKAVLNDGDLLKLGCITFKFASGSPGDTPLLSAPPAQFRDASGKTSRIQGPLFVIGRRRDSDLPLTGRNVGRAHALIAQAHGHYVMLHLSANRTTLLNGQPLDETVLRPGQVVEIGEHQLAFELLAESAPSEPPIAQLDAMSQEVEDPMTAAEEALQPPVSQPPVSPSSNRLLLNSAPLTLASSEPDQTPGARAGAQQQTAPPLPLEFASPAWIDRCGPLARAMISTLNLTPAADERESVTPAPEPPSARRKGRLLIASGSLLGGILLGTWFIYQYFIH